MATTKPSTPKGTRDFGPAESAKRSYIQEVIKRNFIKYGFSQIETPAMELLDVLTGKYGDEGDQLLFKILNSGDFLKNTEISDYQKGSKHLLPQIAKKGLRYDLTVPFARFVAQNRGDLTFPFRRFQIQPVWRADRPQKGRYQEFYQCDADIIGSTSIWNEVELTLLIRDVFADLNYDQYVLKINHREILYGLAKSAGLSGKEIAFCTILDKIDKIGSVPVLEELISIGGIKETLQSLLDFITRKESLDAKLRALKETLPENKGLEPVLKYFDYLDVAGGQSINIELDFSLARGLTYYTGFIFEVKSLDVEIGSICGGGRYDDLTGVFGLEGTSGIGISFGLDRIYDVLQTRSLYPDNLINQVKVLITHFDETSFKYGLKLLEELRSHSINAMIYPDQTKLKKQIAYADKLGITQIIILGTEEVEKNVYSLKNLQTGEQTMCGLEEVLESLNK